MRSAVQAGLAVIGDLSGPGDRFAAFDIPLNQTVARALDAYDRKDAALLTVWLDCGPKGRELVRQLSQESPQSEADATDTETEPGS